MERKDFTAGINDNDRRLDKVIRKFLPDTSLTDIYKAIRKGLIKINNKKVKIDSRIFKDDIISIPQFLLNNKKQSSDSNVPFSLPEVVFENNHLITFNKPRDMLVQGTDKSLDKMVQLWFKHNFNDQSLSFTPGPLHRIDRNTTGLITFSKSIDGAHWFSDNIKNHNIRKKYLTILEGKIVENQIWKDFIDKTSDNKNGFHTVNVFSEGNSDSINDKIAHTIVKPIQTGNYQSLTVTLAEIEIKTGRMHQIRAQSSFHNHPLLGDTAYNGHNIDSYNSFFLHAYELISPSNNLGFPETLKINLPKDFKNFLYESCSINISEV